MPRLTIDIEARLASFQDSLSKIERDAGRAASKIEGAFSGLNSTLAALGATVSVGAFAAFIKDGIAAQSALDDLSESTSLTVETLSSLREVARVSGADLNQVAAVAGKFAKSVGEAAGGNRELQKAFADVGISIEDLQSKNFDELYVDFARAIANADDQQRAFAVGAKLAGRSLQEVLPFFKDLAAEGLGVAKVSAEQAAAAERLEKDIRRLGNAFDDLKLTLAQGVVPALQEMLDDFNTGIRLAGSFGAALRLFGLGISPFKDLAGNLKATREELEKLQAARRLREAGAEFTGDLDPQIADAEKRLAFLKNQEARAALAGRTGGAFQDARDLRLQGRGVAIGSSSLEDAQPKRGKSEREKMLEEIAAFEKKQADELAAYELRAFEDLTRAENEVIRQQAKDRLAAEKQLIEAIDEQMRIEREAGLALPNVYKEMEDAARRNADVARELGLTFQSAFEDAVVAGEGLRDVLSGMAQDLARLVLRKGVTEPAAGFVSGLLKDFDLGSLFSGFFADGGFIPPGKFGIVGERGPEVAFGGRSGQTISPMSAGGGPNLYIDARGADSTALARVERLIRDLNGSVERRAVAAVVAARGRDPALLT